MAHTLGKPKELYMEATEAYEAYNIFELCFISKKLNIKENYH